jgi:hypothetical protein
VFTLFKKTRKLYSTKIVKFVKNTTIMTAILDKELIRKSLIDLAMVEPEFVSALILEVDANLKKSKKQRLTEIIKEDFEEYGEVFKALA